MDRYRYVFHGVKNHASSTVEQSPWTLEAGRSCAKGWYNTWLTVLFEVSSNYEMDGRRERGRESSGRRRFNTMSTARSTTTTTPFRSGLDRPGGWLSCTSLVRVSMEIGGGKVMSQAARTFISGCTGWISEFVVAPRPLARAGVGKREEVGRGGGVHSPLDGELIHVWNSSDLWPPTSASLSPPPSLSLSNVFLFPVWF